MMPRLSRLARRAVALAKADGRLPSPVRQYLCTPHSFVVGFGWIHLDGLFDQRFMSLDFGIPNPMARLSRRSLGEGGFAVEMTPSLFTSHFSLQKNGR